MAYKQEADRLKKIGAKAYAAEQKAKAAKGKQPTPEKVQNINPTDKKSQARIKEIREQPQNINPTKRTLKERVDNPKNFGEKALSVAASPKTTAVLGGVLAAETGYGLATGAFGSAGAATAATTAGRATITSTSTAVNSGKIAGEMVKRGSFITTQRAFVGKASTSGVNKIFHAVRPIATRYATNAKSQALTKGFMVKLGISLGAAGFIKDVLGTYPFAGFLKEEAVQTTGFPISKAIAAGNMEDAQTLLDYSNEMINNKESIVDKIPYANVQKSVANYMEAQAEANVVWQNLIDTTAANNEKLATGQDDFSVAQNQRAIQSQEDDIKKSEVFQLRREGKYDEADELEQEILRELKGRTE